MSSDIAIKVENISKCYHIYDKARDRLLQMLLRGKKQYYREFWALKEVSFEIRKGETIGIIGRNGAGKSTLLQMICGTLNPTSGQIQTNGRVAALLELGAGFNPAFTGRENIYMAASLYGLSTDEVNEKFSEISAFSEIGDFIEQPVGIYSSGMFVRLAFALVVHVDPDILIIDEALAVGDYAFVQKCYRRLDYLRSRGVTLLFVTHDTTAIKMLSERAVWLHEGRLKGKGASSDVVDAYRNWLDNINVADTITNTDSGSDLEPIGKRLQIKSVSLLNESDPGCSTFLHDQKALLDLIVYNASLPDETPLRFGFSIRNNRGIEICGSNTEDAQFQFFLPEKGAKLLLLGEFFVPLIAAGEYSVSFNIDVFDAGDWITEIYCQDYMAMYITEKVKVHTLLGLPVSYRAQALITD